VLARERLPVHRVDEQDVGFERFGERDVRRVAVVAVAQDVRGFREGLGERKDVRDPHTAEAKVEARPGRDAMKVGVFLDLIQGVQLREAKDDWMAARAIDLEGPALRRDLGVNAEVEHGPLVRLRLPHGQARHSMAIRGAATEG